MATQYTKEREMKLIYDIVDQFGGENKVFLKNKLDHLVKFSRRRLRKRFEDFVDMLDENEKT